MKVPLEETQLLAELLTGSIRDDTFTKGSPRAAVRDILLKKGWAEYNNKTFMKGTLPGPKLLGITPAGRQTYAMWANQKANEEDSKTDDQEQTDPGPVFRMVAHLKEAAMVAFRFGHNSVRAKQPEVVIGAKEALRITLERALANTADEATIKAFLQFLTAQIDKGIAKAEEK